MGNVQKVLLHPSILGHKPRAGKGDRAGVMSRARSSGGHLVPQATHKPCRLTQCTPTPRVPGRTGLPAAAVHTLGRVGGSCRLCTPPLLQAPLEQGRPPAPSPDRPPRPPLQAVALALTEGLTITPRAGRETDTLESPAASRTSPLQGPQVGALPSREGEGLPAPPEVLPARDRKSRPPPTASDPTPRSDEETPGVLRSDFRGCEARARGGADLGSAGAQAHR